MTALFEMRIRVGGDPRNFSEFAALNNELAKLTHPACPEVDWVKVERLCLALFERNGAELHTVAYYMLARSHLYGLEGMAQGVAMIEALSCEWPQLWPPIASARVDILIWLFAQLPSLIRGLKFSAQHVPTLLHMAAGLERLDERLMRQTSTSVTTLNSLREQIGNCVHRLERSTVAANALPRLQMGPDPALTMPIVVLPTVCIPLPLVPTPEAKKRRTPLWVAASAALIAVSSWLAWDKWSIGPDSESALPFASIFHQEQKLADPVHLDSLSLFDAGSTELKPGATKILINALVSIKAQPGWLIVITGHSDTTGDAAQNMKISQARAAAVRDWMKSMGDIPDSCFAVQGLAATQPLLSNDTEPGRAANRRVDIRLVPQSGACEQVADDATGKLVKNS
ncbi:OmpA family protein [Pseudomonas caspiana]